MQIWTDRSTFKKLVEEINLNYPKQYISEGLKPPESLGSIGVFTNTTPPLLVLLILIRNVSITPQESSLSSQKIPQLLPFISLQPDYETNRSFLVCQANSPGSPFSWYRNNWPCQQVHQFGRSRRYRQEATLLVAKLGSSGDQLDFAFLHSTIEQLRRYYKTCWHYCMAYEKMLDFVEVLYEAVFCNDSNLRGCG